MGETGDDDQARGHRTARDALATLVGIADLGLETSERLLGTARGLLGRSDLLAMAADAQADVKARGDVVLGRITPPAVAHMETLARVKAARHAAEKPSASPAPDAAGGA